MRKSIVTLFIFLLAVPGILAQDAASVIETYFEKNGGKENFENITTMQIEGEMTLQGMIMPFELKIKDPDKQKTVVDIQGQKMVMAYDGETAWMINPMMGSTEPTEVTGPQAESMKQNNFEEPFLKYGKEGHDFAYEGDDEMVNGAATYKISHTRPDGNTDYHFIDKETYMRLMTRSTVTSGPVAGSTTEVYFKNIDEVEGSDILMPYGISAKSGGEQVMSMKIDSYTLNADIADSLFEYTGN